MTSSRVGARMLAASVLFGVWLGGAPMASAQPGQPAPPPPVPASLGMPAPPPAAPAPPPGPAPLGVPVEDEGGPPAVVACRQFTAVLRVSSVHYNNFAHAIAGSGAQVNYSDPLVTNGNVEGRSALRKAAAEAMSASGTPGLQPEIANPMRLWSLQAARLAITMGLQGDGNALNNAATDLNDEAKNAQMACANAGAQPIIRGGQDQP